MIASVLKMHFCKLPPKVISYRDFKKFENKRFKDSLNFALNSQNIDYTKNLDLFFNRCQNELNHHFPRKKKYIRGKNKPFIIKTLSRSTRERTCFRSRFLKNPTDENRLSDINGIRTQIQFDHFDRSLRSLLSIISIKLQIRSLKL